MSAVNTAERGREDGEEEEEEAGLPPQLCFLSAGGEDEPRCIIWYLFNNRIQPVCNNPNRDFKLKRGETRKHRHTKKIKVHLLRLVMCSPLGPPCTDIELRTFIPDC